MLIPNLKNVGLGLPNSINRLEESFDPTNFLKTKTYGTSPSNTTITVKYFKGGGVDSNVPQGELTQLDGVEYEEDISQYTTAEIRVLESAKNSIAVDNEIPAIGGRGGETIEDERGLTVQEVKALDELYVWLMKRRKDRRGYIISSSGR